MKKIKISHPDINLTCLAFAIGQRNPKESAFSNVEAIAKYVKSFNTWEKENVLSLPNGWEDYMENGGDDYESVIYEWAKSFDYV